MKAKAGDAPYEKDVGTCYDCCMQILVQFHINRA